MDHIIHLNISCKWGSLQDTTRTRTP